MRPLLLVLLLPLAACGSGSGGSDSGGSGSGSSGSGSAAPVERPDRFDSAKTWSYLKFQVALGERPAGSEKSRQLAAYLKKRVRGGRYQRVPGGLRNVIGEVPGKKPGDVVLVGAHYDSKDIPGFVGANDSASGTAVVLQLAREIKPRTIDPTLLFVFFDGEETPRGVPDSQFEKRGLRGSKVAAKKLAERVDQMVLLDFVGDKDLRIPREAFSDEELWKSLRAAAKRAGAASVFPNDNFGGILDDHIPFIKRGVPSIDLIDFDFPCWHQTCDDLPVVSERSLDRVGETMRELLPTLG